MKSVHRLKGVRIRGAYSTIGRAQERRNHKVAIRRFFRTEKKVDFVLPFVDTYVSSSSKNFFNDMSMHIGESALSTIVIVGQFS